MKNNHIIALAILSGVIITPLITNAWTAPASAPTGGNVSAPINAGNVAQAKIAGILLNSGDNSVGLTVYGVGASSGKVMIGDAASPQYKMQVGKAGDGSAIGSNAFYYMSDANLKKNIETASDSLSKVLQLRGVTFNWKSTDKADVGVVAQEVEKVYPEVVNTGSDGIKAVEYGHLVGPLIEAIKAQQKQIEDLKARVAALEASK